MNCISAHAVPNRPYICAARAALPPTKSCTSMGSTGMIMGDSLFACIIPYRRIGATDMLPTRSSPTAMDPEEWRLRCELTDFYHLVDFLGWTEMIFNHISVRLPGAVHRYLVNPFGLNYAEITPENLLKVGVDGRLVEPADYPANPAGFALHGAIHEKR